MQQAVASLFPEASIICVAGKIDDYQEALFPEERIFIQSAVPKRVREFTAGRSCARIALKQFELAPMPILPDAQRAPIWPTGYTGSITHTDDTVAALVARTAEVQAIGVDMEHAQRVEKKLWSQLFTSNETTLLESLSGTSQMSTAALFFSAKEAFFKFQFPLSRQWINFKSANVRIIDNRTFGLELVAEDSLEDRSDYTGHYCFHKDYVITGIWTAKTSKKLKSS